MIDKAELIKRLRSDPLYRDALKMAPTDAERRRIIAAAEGLLGTFVDALSPLAARVAADPKLVAELQRSLQNGATIVRESDGRSVASGSSG